MAVSGFAHMTLSQHTLTLVALLALVLAVVAIGFALMGGRRMSSPSVDSATHLDDSLRGVLEGQAAHLQRLEKAMRVLNNADKRQQGQIQGSVRHMALVRYDAFEDVGGRLSFSCAMLDGEGSGVVITSINGRQDTRVYAKPVTGGTSSYNLSTEEEDAIKQALSTPREEAVRR
jgi:Protein of unknown function (DUF4446)